MYYQHNTAQIVHKDDERNENEERQKLLSKESEVPEK
jgi:hypothetical protein